MTLPLLALEQAAFSYGERAVFANVHLHVNAGDVVTVLGTNGSGKSTLLRCLGGVLPLARGRVLLDGEDLAQLDGAARARSIGFLFQDHAPTLPFTVREVAQLGRTPHLGWLGGGSDRDERIVEEAIEEAGVLALADRPYTALSGGERQLVLLARTLAQQPRVILMDEPTAHLDLRNQVRCLAMIRALAARGVAVVVTTHDPHHAFVLGGQVALLKTGTPPIIGLVEEVVTESALSATYGIDIRLHATAGGTFCSPW